MRLRHRLIVALAVMLLAFAFQVARADGPAKAAIPDAAALKTAAKLVEDVYKDELAAAKTPAQKLVVAQKMLDAVKDEKDPATLFTVLTKTVNLACQAADLQSAFTVIDRIDADFVIDTLKLRADAAGAAARSATAPEQDKALIPLAAGLVDSALAADRYDIAKDTSVLIADAARASQDPALQTAAGLRLQQVREAQQAFDENTQALKVLADNPTDPAANLKVGKFRCLVKGDWDAGLPALALSSDESLKSLAKTETAGIGGVDEQIKLADGWWDLAEKYTDQAKSQMQVHAAQWYRVSLASLSGLAKLRVEKRLADSPYGNPPAQAANVGPGTIDLLALANTTADVCEGKWTLKNSELSTDSSVRCKMQLPYHAPAEYDFHIQFSREEGNDAIVMVLTKGDRYFAWIQGGWNNKISAFDLIAGKRGDHTETAVRSNASVENGKKYDVLVKVRATGLQTYVNGELVAQWKTNYEHMQLAGDWHLNDMAALGIGSASSTVKFSKIEVTEVTGTGQFTRPNLSPINLLALVDTDKDSCGGVLVIKDGELRTNSKGRCKLQLPYRPPAEYDFHVVFSRDVGTADVVMILSAGERSFAWVMAGWKNTVSGFDRIGGANAEKNKTGVHSDSAVENGKKYDVIVKVRKTGVEAYTDGKLVSQWKTNYSDMTLAPAWSLRDQSALGVGTESSAAKFYKIEVTEVTGRGEFTRPIAGQSTDGTVVASSTSSSVPGLHVPAATLHPYTTPPQGPAGPLQFPSSTPPQAANLPAAPANPNAIERPEFANIVKPVVKNITTITSMMVRVSDDGDTLGLTTDIIASVPPETRHSRDVGAGFNRSKVGEDMKTSFEEAVRAVHLRYPTWDGRIDFSFGEKYTEHDGGSAGTAFGVLLLSSLEGFEIDPKCAVTGDITVDWKVRKVAGVASKIHGAILDKCLYAAIPTGNEEVINDLPFLYGDSSLWDIQTLSIPTLQEAVATLRTDRDPKLAEALKLFADLQPTLAKSGRAALRVPATIAALKHIVELAPNHLSAKALLAIADNTAPKTLSSSASLYRFSIIAYPYCDFINGRKPIDRNSLPAAVTANARKQIEPLRRIASKEIQPLVTDLAGLIEVAEQAAANRARSPDFDRSRDTLLAHLATVSANREFLEKLVREGY